MAKFIKVDVKGVEEAIRFLDQTDDNIRKGSIIGLREASKYLVDKIKSKFGTYQPGWAKLAYDTVVRKVRKGQSSRPLLATGKMKESVKARNYTSGNRLKSTVYSDDEKIIHHIFGAPRAGVPKRDPMLITTTEEEDEITNIISNAISNEISKGE